MVGTRYREGGFGTGGYFNMEVGGEDGGEKPAVLS